MRQIDLGDNLFIGMLASMFFWSSSHASIPVWTYSAPIPKNLILSSQEIGTVEYTITNQSRRAKRLRLKPTQGLSASECYLATQGSTCILTLTVDGSKIPSKGIHEGPILCELGNPQQCYRPSSTNTLSIALNESPIIPSTKMAAVGSFNVGFFFSPLGYYSQDNGKTWLLSNFNSTLEDESLSGISCNSNGFCVAVGSYEGGANSKPVSYYSENYGKNWFISPSLPTPQGNWSTLSSVACNANGKCTALGVYYTTVLETTPLSYYSEDYGKHWALSLTQPPAQGVYNTLAGVSCNTQGRCAAVGAFSNTLVPLSYKSTIYYSEDNGKNWALALVPNLGTNDQLRNVSCNDNSICVAVGIYADLTPKPLSYYSTNNGKNWAVSTTLPPAQNTNLHQLASVSCTPSGTCTTVGFYVNTFYPEPLSYYSEDNGVNWVISSTLPPTQSDSTNDLSAVYCQTNGACAAGGYYYTSGFAEQLSLGYYSEDNGVTWFPSLLAPLAGGTNPVLNAIS